VHDADLAAVDDLTDGSHLVRAVPVRCGDNRRTFGHTVALSDLNTDIHVVFRQIFGQIAAAAGDPVEASAVNILFQLLERLLRMLSSQKRKTVIKRFGNHRDYAEGSWFKQFQMFGQLAHIPVQAEDAAVTYCQQYVAVNTVNVMDRQNI